MSLRFMKNSYILYTSVHNNGKDFISYPLLLLRSEIISRLIHSQFYSSIYNWKIEKYIFPNRKVHKNMRLIIFQLYIHHILRVHYEHYDGDENHNWKGKSEDHKEVEELEKWQSKRSINVTSPNFAKIFPSGRFSFSFFSLWSFF